MLEKETYGKLKKMCSTLDDIRDLMLMMTGERVAQLCRAANTEGGKDLIFISEIMEELLKRIKRRASDGERNPNN